MSETTVHRKLAEIVAEQLNIDFAEITDTTQFAEDLNADSLDSVEMLMEAEDEFAISITDEDADTIRTFGDAVALVERLVSDDRLTQQPHGAGE